MTVNYVALYIRRRAYKTEAAAAPVFLFPADGLAYMFKGHLKMKAIQSIRPGSKRQMPARNRKEEVDDIVLQWSPEAARRRPGQVWWGGVGGGLGGEGQREEHFMVKGGGRNEGSE